MQSSRLPRFERDPNVAPIDVTERDREIIRQVHRHRFLRSSHIAALVGGSHQQLLRRLQLLYHHGYVERPRCQLDFYYQPGSREIVYGLGDKGGAILSQEGVAYSDCRWSDKNRAVGRVQLEHWLLVSEIMVRIESACRNRGIRLIMGDELVASGERTSFRWNMEIGGGVKLGIAPDCVFALDYAEHDNVSHRDRKSTRLNSSHSSI